MKYKFGSGDDGRTSTYGGRVNKTDVLIKAIGDIDELSAFIGNAMSNLSDSKVYDTLKSIEYDLYLISANIAGYKKEKDVKKISEDDVARLDNEILVYSKNLNDITGFVYPNGSMSATSINICRTIARRAERSVLEVKDSDASVKRYMNRLSSLLFVMFRYLNNADESNEEKFNKD
ncbi:MAG: cob(I)yrinic acid a,c-diamide adenosyltransferase [Candidatus Parvarchaeota archaeon]|nr:cob(I)yrinic acid a,c-diamide adenosyltransferase [Candidatus Parvarchaeota archaeon]